MSATVHEPVVLEKAAPQPKASKVEPLLLLDIHHSGYLGWGVWVTPDAPERWTAETVERLMRHPHYKMGINLGAQSYQQNPRLARRIREWLRMFPGRVFITAGDYAQLTACVRTGESNLRQILVGLEVIRETLGARPTVWTMSEPGNFAQLPQVLDDLGYAGALLRIHGPGQGGGNPTTTAEAGVVRWIGPDGSEVVAIPEYAGDRLDPRDDCPNSMWMMTRYLNLRQKRGNFTLDDLWAWKQRMAARGIRPVVMSKDDDHNSQPWNNNLCMEAGHALVRDTEGDPRFRWVSAAELFSELPEPTVAYRPDPALFETRKMSFCDYGNAGNTDWIADLRTEAKLKVADFSAVLAAELGANVDTEATLSTAWQTHLAAQNHDLSLKRSLDLMYHLQYETERMADEARDAALAPVLRKLDTGQAGAVVAFNPLGWRRKEYATVTLHAAVADRAALVDDAGNVVPWEVVGREAELVTMGFVADVPPLGYRRYLLRPALAQGRQSMSVPSGLSVQGLKVRTPEYAATFGERGGIVSLVPSGDARSVVAPEGIGIAGDIGGAAVASIGAVEIEIGAVSALARERGKLGPFHDYEIVHRMTPGVPHIMLSIRIVPNYLEGTPNAPGFAGYILAAGVSGGPGLPGSPVAVGRKVELSARLAEHLVPTTVMRKAPFLVAAYDVSMPPIFAALGWADYAGKDAGLALLNRGSIGQRWDRERNEANVILASGPIREFHNEVALMAYAGDWRAAGVHEAGLGFAAPIDCMYEPAHGGRLPAAFGIAEIEPANVTVSGVFRRRGKSYVRLWEHAGEEATVAFTRDGEPVAARRVSLELKAAKGGRSIGPRQIATFRLG